VDERAGAHERIRLEGESLDKARAPFEQLAELFGAQLPR
jgi:hypothetical protein